MLFVAAAAFAWFDVLTHENILTNPELKTAGGWLMTGLVAPPPGGNPCPAPTGYDHQLSGECRHPVVPTTKGTWGSLKKLYR